jgi:hypothetical protein
MTQQDDAKLAETAMRWYGWGSPVGLGIFVVCLALAGLIAATAVTVLTSPGPAKPNVEKQLPDGLRQQ